MFSQILEMLKQCITAPFEWFAEMNTAIGFLTFLTTMLFLTLFVRMVILGLGSARGVSSDSVEDSPKHLMWSLNSPAQPRRQSTALVVSHRSGTSIRKR